MDSAPPGWGLTSRYDDFLFAAIGEEANGMRLSVLSALVRMNVDPWEEATRLATMPKAVAQQTLISRLDLIPDRDWSPSEAKVIAARLVQLLPQAREGVANTATEAAAQVRAQRTTYWLVWLGVAMAISFLAPRYQAPKDVNVSTPVSGATATSPDVPAAAGGMRPSGPMD
jgi:hypothetical protein